MLILFDGSGIRYEVCCSHIATPEQSEMRCQWFKEVTIRLVCKLCKQAGLQRLLLPMSDVLMHGTLVCAWGACICMDTCSTLGMRATATKRDIISYIHLQQNGHLWPVAPCRVRDQH